MNPYNKNTSNPRISHHSFENSLQQIHQTNDLLSNIENKITDFMQKDGKNTATFKERSPVGPSGLNSSRSRTSYLQVREENSPLKTRNSTYQDFAQYLSPPNDVKSPPNPANYASNSLSQGNIQPFNAGEYASVGSVARESVDVYNYSQPISRNTINKKDYPTERETSGRVLIEKMNRIEESYEAKIKLLEERLRQSDSEAQALREMNQTLEHQIGQLRSEAYQWQERFSKDMANSEEERGTVRVLRKEMENLERKYRSVLEDKDRLKRQYNELMRVHNQMIEIDMQRNEKSLRESRRMEQNEEQNNEEMQGLVESINSYQQEVAFLKEKNNLMQVQLKYEVEKLQDDLNRQIEENQRLRNDIREDKLVALGTRSPSAMGTIHKTIREVTETSEQKVSTGKYEEEDLKALGREDLVRYAKDLKNMYLNLEGQHHEQVRYNENLQTELESLRRDGKYTDRYTQNASPNGLESNRRITTSYLRTSNKKSPRRELYSEDRTRRGYDASVERRQRLINLQRDLDNVDSGDRFLKTREVIPRKSRSRSKSVKFSPDRGGKGERISFGQPKESMETARSNGEFERELAKLKQMIGEKVPLKKIKERPTKRDTEISGRTDKSDVKGKVKSKTKIVKEKEKKKKL